MMNIYLYIDPGTGSMLFAVLIGTIGTLYFALKGLLIKIKFILTSGKIDKIKNTNKIPLVIFAEDKRYFNIFENILDELENRKINTMYMTMSADDPVFIKKYKYIKQEYIGKGNVAFAKLNFLNANIVLSTTPGLQVYQWKKSKDVNKYVHILHEVGGANEYRMFGLAFYDVVLLSGKFQEEQIRELEEKQKSSKKQLLVVGSTYMDRLKNKYDNIDKKNENNKKVILIAPTWGKTGILMSYGGELIDEILKYNYDIIIRPHPQSIESEKELIEKLEKRYDGKVEFNYDIDNFDVLNKSDIMISDFSGVIFDYSLIFNKPVIYTKFDIMNDMNDSWFVEKEPYRYEAMRKIGIELNKHNIKNIGNIIDEALLSNKISNNINEIRDILWQERGKATKNVVDYIVKSLDKNE